MLAPPRRPLLLMLGEVDVELRVLRRATDEIALSRLEVDLLVYLASRPGEDVGREELLLAVWGHKKAVPTRSVDMAVLRLRRKIERDPSHPEHLLSSRGDGYRLVLAGPAQEPPGNTAPWPDQTVGQETTLAQLAAAHQAGRRQVVLVGPPGVGKSRLARAFAHQIRLDRRPRGGVWVVGLHGARDADQALLRVAQVLGLAIASGAADAVRGQVSAALASRGETLLVLDQVEHLGAALPDLLAPWAATSGLRVLLTSQVRPALPGAQVVAVPLLAADAATALLRDRLALAGLPDWAPEAGDPRLELLLRRLDGLPLAIELVAGRAYALSLDQMLDRLDARQRLLVGPGGGGRAGALAATLATSWGLLQAAEQEALVRLAAFPAGLRASAAERVLGASADALLDALIDRSLLRQERGRYVLLAAVRAFALSAGGPSLTSRAEAVALDVGGEAAMDLARRLCGLDGARAAAEAEEELDNLQHALELGLARQDPRVVPLILALDALMEVSGSVELRKAQLTRALAAVGPHAALLLLDARLASLDAPRAEVMQRFEAAWQAGRAAHAQLQGEVALYWLSWLRKCGDFERADALARDLLGQVVAPWDAVVAAEQAVVRAHQEGEARSAVLVAERADLAVDGLLAAGQVGHAIRTVILQYSVLVAAGELPLARSALQRMSALAQRLGQPRWSAITRYHEAYYALLTGDYAEGLLSIAQATRIYRSAGQQSALLHVGDLHAFLLLTLGFHAEAEALWGELRAPCATLAAPRLQLALQNSEMVLRLDQGRGAEAEAVARGALALCARVRFPSQEVEIQLGLALALAQQGRPDLARQAADGVSAALLTPELATVFILLRVALDGADPGSLESARAELQQARRGPYAGAGLALAAVERLLAGEDLGGLLDPEANPAPVWPRVALRLLGLPAASDPGSASGRRRPPVRAPARPPRPVRDGSALGRLGAGAHQRAGV